MSSETPGQTDTFAHDAANSAGYGASPYAVPSGTAKKRSRGGWVLLLLLLAFAGGIAATLWGGPKIQAWWAGDKAPLAAIPDENTDPLMNGSADTPATRPSAPPAIGAIAGSMDSSLGIAALEARLAAVAARLDGITEQANQAGGNAARAEGLMIAFAARRALDRGAPLGYLEGELRLRFADAQPRAVATIINAAHAPVTIADLQAGLEEVAPQLLGTGGAKTDWWTATKRELSNLIIIRKADTPSPVPQKVIERARLLLSVGRVTSALQEIERLPGREKAENWLQMARQYNEARRALDVIEAAAILEPRNIPAHAAPRLGNPSLQVAPTPEEEESNAASNAVPATSPAAAGVGTSPLSPAR